MKLDILDCDEKVKVRFLGNDSVASEDIPEPDVTQREWTDTEWTVFTAKAIVEKAEYVSREDLCLMKEILERCRKSVSKKSKTAE